MGRLFLPVFLLIHSFLTTCLGDERPYFRNESYNNGEYGQYVTQTYRSSDVHSARLNVQSPFSKCDDGSKIFIAPRGEIADTKLMILDAE